VGSLRFRRGFEGRRPSCCSSRLPCVPSRWFYCCRWRAGQDRQAYHQEPALRGQRAGTRGVLSFLLLFPPRYIHSRFLSYSFSSCKSVPSRVTRKSKYDKPRFPPPSPIYRSSASSVSVTAVAGPADNPHESSGSLTRNLSSFSPFFVSPSTFVRASSTALDARLVPPT
jgi:hypothetical protein